MLNLYAQYNKRLEEIDSIDIGKLPSEGLEELCSGFEVEMNTLDSQRSLKLPAGTRATLQNRFLMQIHKYRVIVRIIRLLQELSCMFIRGSVDIRRNKPEQIMLKLFSEFHGLISNINIGNSLTHRFQKSLDYETQRITSYYISSILPPDIKESLYLIELTLKEPELYTLPSLIMWRETAEDKIDIIQNSIQPKIPQPIEDAIVNKYMLHIKQLKAEILKLRTYPIPEPWCSECMRQGMAHIFRDKFIFFTHPGIEEEMKPLNLYERDTLPGRITQMEYLTRMGRLLMESTNVRAELEKRNATNMEFSRLENLYDMTEGDVAFSFKELPLLYRDGRALEYLVNKNEDDKLLKEIYAILLREIRHQCDNRIDIPSFIVDYRNQVARVAPPKQERDLPTASGIDRGGERVYQLVTPASVLVAESAVIVVDKYGHLISIYRSNDLAPTAWFYLELFDSPVSIALHQEMLYVCYSQNLVKLDLILEDVAANNSTSITLNASIHLAQACCVVSNSKDLFVGTLEPSIILMNSETLTVIHEYQLNPIRYETERKNRFPWLQDMKATNHQILCLFTGSPSPLQMFSLEGDLIKTVLTEDQIKGAYHFDLYWNLATCEPRIYITDFWDSSIKVFDLEGNFVETFSEKGFGLGQIFHPTGIYIQNSGYITICDMKEENCLQRL